MHNAPYSHTPKDSLLALTRDPTKQGDRILTRRLISRYASDDPLSGDRRQSYFSVLYILLYG